MRKLIVLFGLTALLVPVTSHAQWNNWSDAAYPYQVTISSLPFTVDRDSTLYTVAGDLSTVANGIHINGVSYSKIKGNGRTLTFDGSGTGGHYGVYLHASDHVVVEGLTIMQAATSGQLYGNTGGPNVIGFILGPNNHILVKNCNVHVRGHSSIGFDGAYGDAPFDSWAEGVKTEIEIDGGNFTSYVQSFDNRMWNDAAVMKLDCKPFVQPEQYNFYVHNVVVDSACHTGLLVMDVAWFEYNNVTIDAHNERPSTSWANAHGIGGGNLEAGSRFRYNTVRSGSNHYGGRGMYFDYSVGTAAAPIEIAYNDIRISSGQTTENPAARGIRIRWGCFYLRVHHNYIEVYADDDPATQQISEEAHGIWYTEIGEEGSALGSYNEIYNNTIKTIWSGSSGATPTHVGALMIEQVQDPSKPFGNGCRSYHNRLVSNVHPLMFGELNGGCQEWTSYQDTIEWALPHMTDGYNFSGAVTVGYYNGPSDNNRVIDPVFINAAVNNVVRGGNTGSAYVMRSVELAVKGTNGLPVSGATVHLWPRQAYADSTNLSAAVVAKTTGTNGLVRDTVPYLYRRWSGASLAAESTYNDYRLRVAKGGDITWRRTTLTDPNVNEREWGQFQDTLALPNTAGDGAWGSEEISLWVEGSSQPEGTSLMFIVRASGAAAQNVTYNFATQNGSAQAPGDFTAASGVGTILAGQTADTISVATVNDAIAESNEAMTFVISNSSQGAITGATAVGTIIDDDTGTDNTPPAAPVLHTPTQGSVLRTTTPVLGVLNSDDRDGDVLTYDFEVYDAVPSLVAGVGGVAEGAATTRWTVPVALQDGAAYTWRARSYDGEEYSPWMSTASFSIDMSSGENNLPTLPVHASPSAGDTLVSAPIVLRVDNAIDPDGDDVTYDFFLYADAGLSELVEEHLGVPETPQQTAVVLDLTPVDGSTYWWRVRASDGIGATAPTEATSFFYYSLYTGGEDEVPEPVSPGSGATVYTTRPVLKARNAALAGTPAYFFQVASDETFTGIVSASDPVAEDPSGVTEWQVADDLEVGETYYWRVRADNEAYSAPAAFQVGFEVVAYPNPVHFQQGEVVTITLPDEPIDLLIQSISGETVLIEDGVSGRWTWDGRNASGNLVAIGVYSWFAKGGAYNGKIVVMP